MIVQPLRPMKKIFLLSAAGAALCLAGCSHTTGASTDVSGDSANPTAPMVVAASSSASTTPQPDNARVNATADTAHPTAAATDAPRASSAPVTPTDAAAAAPMTYPNKETYPHTPSGASSTALIGGGAPQSGGEPIAPSASVIEGRVKEWRLSAADLQAEIGAGTPIVRTKAIGADAPTGRTDDEALHTLINNRLLADSDTVRVATKMDVKNGEVTLRGDAASAELIGRAMAIALDTNGVTKVTSEMKIDPSQPGALRDDASRIPSDRPQLQSGTPEKDNR
jgi:hypothetical protein